MPVKILARLVSITGGEADIFYRWVLISAHTLLFVSKTERGKPWRITIRGYKFATWVIAFNHNYQGRMMGRHK